MRYPWANILLLTLGILELLTGFLGLTWGSPDLAIVLQLHRAGGFAILALLLWKGRNIIPSLRRPERWRRLPATYAAFSAALALLLIAMGLGLAWSHLGPFSILAFSGVSWHIYLSAALVPLVMWHVLFHRWSLRFRFWADRRSLLKAGGLLAVGFLLWRASESALGLLGLPGARRRFTGSYEANSYSANNFPTVSWLNDRPSPVRGDTWRLSVTGVVDRTLSLTYDEIAMGKEQRTAVLDCTGGWYSTQEWEGVSLGAVLESAGLRPEAASVTVRSVTGYYRRFNLQEAAEYVLATRVGGQTLSHSHGFPVRLVAPNKRGYDWVKWVTAIEVNDTGKWLQPPLPLQ